MNKIIAICESCGKERLYGSYSHKAKDYVPRLCKDCYDHGARVQKVNLRSITPWRRDQDGTLSRSLTGGA